MTKTFKIEAWNSISNYKADTPEAAILAYVTDAGYSSIDDAADVCGQSVEEFLADITVTECVTDPRTMTEMFLVRAARPESGARLDCFIEAENEERALEMHRLRFGFYDSQADYPDWKDIEVVEVPFLTGEPAIFDGFEFV